MGDPFLTGIGASLVAGAATALGALPIFFVRRVSPQLEDMMLGFGAGVMLAASFFSLLNPALAAAPGMPGIAIITAGLVAGSLLLYAADRLLPHEHFILGVEGSDPGRLRRIWLFVLAITIHNFPEGLSVGVSVASGEEARGAALTVGIALQNIPEGLVVALALAAEGYRRPFAFLVAFATGLVEPVGGALGAGGAVLFAAGLPWMLALAAGAMIYVISDEIIPETHRRGHQSRATASLMAGFVVMMLLDSLLH